MTDEICPQCVLGAGTLCDNGVPYRLYTEDDKYGNGNGNAFKCRAWKMKYCGEDDLNPACENCEATEKQIEDGCCENCESCSVETGFCKYCEPEV